MNLVPNDNPSFRSDPLTLVCFALFFASGCGYEGSETLNFRNKIAAANLRLQEEDARFCKALKDHFYAPSRTVMVRQPFEQCLRVETQVQTEMKALEVPKAKKAQELYDEELRYLQIHENVSHREFTKLLTLHADLKLDPQVKDARIQRIIAGLEKELLDGLAKVREADQEFARAHGLPLQAGK